MSGFTRQRLGGALIAAGAVCLAAATMAPGCGASAPAHSFRVPHACRDSPDDRAADRCVGWLVDQLMTSWLGVYDDAGLAQYVRSVGARVAVQAHRGDVRWTFTILDDPGVQAWASPGGHIYVTRGILAQLSSEAELAALLGHEVGHVARGHTDHLLDSVPDPRPETLPSLSLSFENERDEEREADMLAVIYMRRAGYDPAAAARMLSAIHRGMPQADEPAGEETWADRHPPLPVRLALVDRTADGRGRGSRGRARYLDHIDGLVLGPDPRRGTVEGGRFVHREGGFSFAIPDGWEVQPWRYGEIRSQWLHATDPDGQLQLSLMRLSDRGASILEESVHAALAAGPTRTITLAGLTAMEGTLDEDDAASSGGSGADDATAAGGEGAPGDASAAAEDASDDAAAEHRDESRDPADDVPGFSLSGMSGTAHMAIFEARDGASYALAVFPQADGPLDADVVFHDVERSFRPETEAGARPVRLRLRSLDHDRTLLELSLNGCGSPADLELLARLNHQPASGSIQAGQTAKCPSR